jgi:hypothetical protein
LHPEKSVKGLVRLYLALDAMPAGHWKSQKLKETKTLIEQCSGLFMDVTSAEQFAVQTDSIRFNFAFNNRLGTNAILKKVSVDGLDSAFNQPLNKNRNVFFSKTFYVPSSKPLTQPYWLANKMEEGYFNVTDQQKIGQADVDPSYMVSIVLNIEGTSISFQRAVKFKFTDPVKGELYEPLVVIPSMLLNTDASIRILVNKNDRPAGEVSVTGKKRGINVSLYTDQSNIDTNIIVNPSEIYFPEKNKTVTSSFSVKGNGRKKYLFVARDNDLQNTSSASLREIKYDHIPYINYIVEPSVTFVGIDVRTHNKKIGYIIGAGDKVPEALDQMGYDVTLLTEKELARNNLQQFDAILAGVRAYNTNDWLGKYYDKLMKYVSDGGNYIVQYNTGFRQSQQPRIGPYKFDIVNRRITDENAPVTILKPEHPVFNFPNKITPDDFRGWIQERSIYHAGAWDTAKFVSVMAMSDPGEKPEEGGLVIAKHGKGVFVYTGLVFFRELPAGVPGAYRLLANIIALNRKRAF